MEKTKGIEMMLKELLILALLLFIITGCKKEEWEREYVIDPATLDCDSFNSNNPNNISDCSHRWRITNIIPLAENPYFFRCQNCDARRKEQFGELSLRQREVLVKANLVFY
jgi:hypothetical protein